MFQRAINDLKDSAGSALRLGLLAAAVALALLAMLAFLFAAAFSLVLERYGPVEACLSGAGIFFVVTMIAAACYMVLKSRSEARAAARKKSAVHAALADPVLVATGIRLVRTLGVKRLIPILAVGGLALGLLASRNATGDQTPAE